MKTDNSNIVVESLEKTIGYKLAISFKPFIDPKCSEHMEIVKDMAKSINSSLNTPEAKGQIFNKGYSEGKNYQSEQYKAILESHAELLDIVKGLSAIFYPKLITQKMPDEKTFMFPIIKEAIKKAEKLNNQ